MLFKLDGRPVDRIDVFIVLGRDGTGVWRSIELVADTTLNELEGALRAHEDIRYVESLDGDLIADRSGRRVVIGEYGEARTDGLGGHPHLGTFAIDYADGVAVGYTLHGPKREQIYNCARETAVAS